MLERVALALNCALALSFGVSPEYFCKQCNARLQGRNNGNDFLYMLSRQKLRNKPLRHVGVCACPHGATWRNVGAIMQQDGSCAVFCSNGTGSTCVPKKKLAVSPTGIHCGGPLVENRVYESEGWAWHQFYGFLGGECENVLPPPKYHWGVPIGASCANLVATDYCSSPHPSNRTVFCRRACGLCKRKVPRVLRKCVGTTPTYRETMQLFDFIDEDRDGANFYIHLNKHSIFF